MRSSWDEPSIRSAETLADAEPSALDLLLPSYDAVERHSILVNSAPDTVYRAVLTTDLGRPLPVRLLMGLRAVPAALTDPAAAWRRLRGPASPVTVRTIAGYDFALLADRPGKELVLGIVGRFWRPSGCIVPTDPRRFREPLAPGLARAAWNFSISADGATSRLATETRVECADEAARRSFLRYWRVVQPFSGILRKVMLNNIRRTAEAG